MIIDVNTYIGSWAFRRIKHNDAAGLSKFLKEAGIDKAVVSCVNSILYKDTQEGNLQLMEEIMGYEDYFIPFAIINPRYPGWKKDFIYCIEILGMKGLELYPYYHDYNLTDDFAVELIDLAADMKVPVHLPCAVENLRQRHWLDTTENLSIDAVERVLAICKTADFIITNGPTDVYANRLKSVSASRSGRVYYDFARVDVFNPGFESLVEAAGVDNVVFGSVAPFQYVDTQLVKLHYAKLDDDDKEKIGHKNLENLLGL